MRTLSVIVASAALACAAVSWAQDERPGERSEQRTAGDAVDDTAITTRVKAALIGDDQTPAGAIDVETFNGVVQLSGHVDSMEQKEAAERAARDVSGVREVSNRLVVRAEGSQRTPGAVLDDNVIAAKVNGKIADAAGLSTASDVNVDVDRGVVQLSGFVDDPEKKNRAERLARSVEGVVDVRNDIELRPQR